MHPSLLNPNHGPIGKKRWPGTPVLLGLLTAGIYTFVWYWKISNEMDGFMQRPGAAHKRVRASLFLYLGAIVFLVLGMAGFIVSLGPDIMQDTEPLPEPAGPGLGVFILCILVAFGLLIAGFVLLLMGLWRVWKMMEEEDQRRLAPEPFNATVALVLALLVMVPWVGAILYFAALVITQKGLNRIWAAYRQPPMPTGF
jgi:uncharacterized membrane protein YidH (DUF202 family)